MSANKESSGFRLQDVNRLIHEPARYNIMALLFVVDRAEFLFVQNQTGMTPGNLSSHLAKLEEAGYVEIQKEFVKKMPKTYLRMTEKGREAFEEYYNKMKEVFSKPPGIEKDGNKK